MSFLSWGKCTILVKDLDTTNAVWRVLPTPAEGTTTLETTKGDKTEAKVEGGENEDVVYGKNTYVLNFNIRAAKGRKKPFNDVDGVIDHEYAVALQPEDPDAPGLMIMRAKMSLEDTYNSADGGMWNYSADALVPSDKTSQIKWGKVSFNATDGKTADIQFTEVGAETEPTSVS